jgi:hypothetical protein
VVAHDEGEREQQHIAQQQAVDRLAHHHRVLADIQQQQQHQLAGEQHRRARRGDDAERQRDIENTGEIGLEEMHDPERAEKGAQPDPAAGAQQRGQRAEIQHGVAGQQQDIVEFAHRGRYLATRQLGKPEGGRAGQNVYSGRRAMESSSP